MNLKGRNFLTLKDFTPEEITYMIDLAADAADCLIRIPMCGHVESLNAAMAGGILMYEAARQRRN